MKGTTKGEEIIERGDSRRQEAFLFLAESQANSDCNFLSVWFENDY